MVAVFLSHIYVRSSCFPKKRCFHLFYFELPEFQWRIPFFNYERTYSKCLPPTISLIVFMAAEINLIYVTVVRLRNNNLNESKNTIYFFLMISCSSPLRFWIMSNSNTSWPEHLHCSPMHWVRNSWVRNIPCLSERWPPVLLPPHNAAQAVLVQLNQLGGKVALGCELLRRGSLISLNFSLKLNSS